MAESHKVAIVGSGLAALTAYAALVDAGIAAVVFGDEPDPALAWRRRAASIRQTHMRSESDGHCRSRTFPGLAAREAWRTRNAWPLLLSVTDSYRPSVDEFLADVDAVRGSNGWNEAFRYGRIESVRAVADGFLLDDRGPFRHVLIAPGHPGLRVPDELAHDERVVHAYEPHEYADRIAVVGAGMAAATEWRNAAAAGSQVTSVRRREPLRRPLNLPRHLFTKRGLAAYHGLDRARRRETLQAFSAPSFPPGREWDVRVEVATEVPDDAEQVICATGFRGGWQNDLLLVQLVSDHALATVNGWIELDDDATIPSLTDPTRTLALSGVPAQWAFPAADTLAGMRYVAHRFVQRVAPSHKLPRRWRTR